MKRLAWSILVTSVMCLCTSTSWAYTVTFDDVPTGSDLSYYAQQYGLNMYHGWQVINSVDAGWGTSQSGTQSAVWSGNPEIAAGFDFVIDTIPDSGYAARSVGAYFSTPAGIVLQMQVYTDSGMITTTIGDVNEAWHNHPVVIDSPTDNIRYVHVIGINSPDDYYHFSMDDLTVVPVPEPCSVAVLACAIVPLAGALRKKRNS